MDTKRNTGKETKKMVKNEMDLRFDARSENEYLKSDTGRTFGH